MLDQTMDNSIFDIPAVSSTPHPRKRGRPRKKPEYRGPTIEVVSKPWDSRSQPKPLSEVFEEAMAHSPKPAEPRRSGRDRQQHVPFDAKKQADAKKLAAAKTKNL